MRTLRAVTRQIGDLNGCELTYLPRRPIDEHRAREQHREYEALLRQLGAEVLSLPPEPSLPDSVFVEDAALVLPEIALVLPMGAPSRRPESHGIAAILAPFREVRLLEGPGTIDGGDILRLGHRLYVGRSSRTNEQGIESLRRAVDPFGYEVRSLEVRHCLHLKSACTEAGDGLLLVNPERVDVASWGTMEILCVDPEEPDASNVLRVGDTVVASACFPRTLDRLRAHGLDVRPLDNSEILKAEGALTCTSLLFD